VAIIERQPKALEATLLDMTNALMHRGPDDAGYALLAEDGVALGMRRLSILDIEGGRQPMWDENGTRGIVFNGEIYNASELRAGLLRAGHVFLTDHSDTEVIVHGYEQWGCEFFHRLNGMFAFAIWDKSRRRLVVARDRAGEKPLYIARTARGYAVASELKALLRHPEVSRELDHTALDQYLSFDYILGPRSILKNVKKLPAGHFALISSDGYAAEPYWSLAFSPSAESEDEVLERFDGLMDESVKRRMVADVPVGLFLSGGLDSTTVGYYMSRHTNNLHSFSIGFEEREFDESHYSAMAARHLGTDHHLEIFSQDRLLELVPRVPEILDEPMADQSIFPTYLLSRFARQSVKVALGGDGSDELLMGYRTYWALRLAARADSLPSSVRSLMAAAAERAPEWSGTD